MRVSRDSTQDARDKYGRALANVFLPNGSLYAEKAALSGFAFRYVYAGKPTTYDARIKKAEASAKAKGLGVWKECGGERRPLRTGTGASGFPAPKAVPGKTAEPAAPVAVPVPSMAGFSCSLPKTKCAQMASCEEARFYLNSCGVSRLDGDKDGTPCEAICK